MKSEFVFKHIDHSDALVEYAEKRIEKLNKHEMKPTHARWVFSMQRHERRVDVSLHGAQINFQATATTDDLYASVDMAVDKLSKQLAKKKHRVQDHTHGPQPQPYAPPQETQGFEQDYGNEGAVVLPMSAYKRRVS